MQVTALELPGIKLIQPKSFTDVRGFFAETWNRRVFEDLGVEADFVQDNHVQSAMKGTLRGLHFQAPPHAQGKMVRVLKGAILDVAVDVRQNSPHYGNHVAVRLTDSSMSQLWIPAGFAHGYLTLEADTEVLYKVTDYYEPQSEGGVIWDDPELNIDWIIDRGAVLLSDKDRNLPSWEDFRSPF